jgi:hypothetical protein
MEDVFIEDSLWENEENLMQIKNQVGPKSDY